MSGKVEWCGNQSTDMSNMKSPIESKETVISNIPNQAPAVQPPSYEAYEAYEHQPGKELVRPVIVPQTTNIFFVKHLSPFARCYPPALGELPNPIPQDEFLAFIDCLNDVFVAQPALLATAMAGGLLMGTQILPAQIAGGALQVAAVGTSAMVSFLRVKKYMVEVNKNTFAPRGLTAVIMSTKKMMATVGFSDTDAKGKMKLPALSDDPDDKEDPRMRRLRALEGYVSPLSFDVAEQPMPIGTMKQMIKAPNRFQNKFHLKRLIKAREKALKDWRSRMAELETESARIPELQNNIDDIRANAEKDLAAAKTDAERIEIEERLSGVLGMLETDLALERQKRESKLETINSTPDKKKAKLNKKEAKLANRILWVVITRSDGSGKAVVDIDGLEETDSESVRSG